VATAAIEFSRANFQLEVGVRALQRIGMDTTLEGWRGQIKQLREEFKVFSTQELTQGIAVSLLKLREFGFTEQQIKNTQRMAATLSLLTGKDFTESIQGVTYALGSGYFEALQRAGIQISRTIVAQEALNRGYEGGYQSLDDNIRAQLTYDIIMRQIVPLTEDAAKVTETLAGKVTLLGTAWENLKTTLGKAGSPQLKLLLDYWILLVTSFEKGTKAIFALGAAFLGVLAAMNAALDQFDLILIGKAPTREAALKAIADRFTQIKDSWQCPHREARSPA